MSTKSLPDVIYGRKFGMALTLDIVKPQSPSGVGVIALSSGGWKSFPEMGKPGTEEFTRRGQTVFVVCHGSRPRFAIPEIVADIRRAIRFARFHAGEHGVDPDRLGLYGISSGGNISLLTAAQGGDGNPAAEDPVDRQSDRVGAVACFYPPTDLANFGEPGKVWVPYRLADETASDAELAKTYSPVTYFTPAMPPTLLIHGDADVQVPIQQSKTAIERLTALGVKNRFETRLGKAHGWPGIAQDNELCAEWFDTHLRP
ncbi:hypothetical protein BH10PLA1_BH10PLA1_19610 [soil metagenome]